MPYRSTNNSTTCRCEGVEYLTSTFDDFVIKCDEIINRSCYEYCVNKLT